MQAKAKPAGSWVDPLHRAASRTGGNGGEDGGRVCEGLRERAANRDDLHPFWLG
jgi:hypothetical protein